MSSAGLRATRTLTAVSAALFADSLLYSAVVPVLPLHAEDHHASTTAIGLLFASYAAALLAVTPVAALVSERVGHRRMVGMGMAGVTVATVGFALSDSYGSLLAARSLQGAAAALVWTSGMALVAEVVDEHRQGTAMGGVMAAVSMGLLLGPPISGTLADLAGFRAAFLVLAAASAVCGALQLLLPAGGRTRTAPAAFRALRLPGFILVLAAVAVAAGCLAMLEPLVPLSLRDRLGADSRDIGLAFGAATLAHLVVAPFVGMISDRCARTPLTSWGLVGMGLTVPLLAIPSPLRLTVVTLAAFAVAYTFVVVPALPRIAAASRAVGDGYAAAYGTFNVAFAVGMMTGPALGGAVASALSVGGALLMTSVFLVGAGLCLRLLACTAPQPAQAL